MAIALLCSYRYDEFLQAQAYLREKLHNETSRICADVVDFKLHIQTHLAEYEERVEKASLENDAPSLL